MYYAIIVAGGSGRRMQADIPKQFLLLQGKPVLMRTIAAFWHSRLSPRIILVINKDYISYWQELCIQYQFTIPHQIIEGGSQRFHSVKNALNLVPDEAVAVAVHDAVRPVISDALITRCFEEAEKNGSGVCGVQSRDSVRKIEDGISVALNRENIFLMQTPQAFRTAILKEAYAQEYRPEFTDDASVVEKAGWPVHVIPGEYENIKITFPRDLEIATLLISKLNPAG